MSRKEWEYKFHIGNVIEDPEGSKWIVTEVHDYGEEPSLEAVAFDAENVSTTQLLEDNERKQTCHCEAYSGDGEYEGNDPECNFCHGNGFAMIQVKGWKRSKVLACSVQDYIIRHMKKAFNLVK